MDPLTLGVVAQGVIGGAKSIFGAVQRSRANRNLRRLQRERPEGYIPSAIVQLAESPVAEEYIEAGEMGDQRRTSQGIGAAQLAGSRGIIGSVPQLVEGERISQQQRLGEYEQARRQALGVLGNAQERVRQENRQDWLNQVAAQTAELGAGQQNIFGGLTDIGMAGIYGTQIDPRKTGKTFGDIAGNSGMVDLPMKGVNQKSAIPSIRTPMQVDPRLMPLRDLGINLSREEIMKRL